MHANQCAQAAPCSVCAIQGKYRTTNHNLTNVYANTDYERHERLFLWVFLRNNSAKTATKNCKVTKPNPAHPTLLFRIILARAFSIKQTRNLNQKQPPKKVAVFVSAERLELSTNGLKGRCSAIELRAQTCEDGFYHYLYSTSIRVFNIMPGVSNFTKSPCQIVIIKSKLRTGNLENSEPGRMGNPKNDRQAGSRPQRYQMPRLE